MKIINSNVELWQQDDKIAHVARCARICYGKESGNDKVLYNNLIKNGHWSMFRHETQYYIIPGNVETPSFIFLLSNIINELRMPLIGIDIKESIDRDIYYVVINGNWTLSNPKYSSAICKYQVDKDLFINYNEADKDICREMVRYTFHITTQRITSSDTNRSSPNNIAERSTRYINFEKRDRGIKICQFEHFNELPKNIQDRFIAKWKEEEELYKDIINAGFKVDIARHALSFPLATQCIYTYSVKEWRHFIDNRYYGVTGRPHDDYKLIAGMIREKLMELGYEFR